MALTKVIGAGVQGISNSSDATAMTIGSDEVVDFASNADFIDGRGIRLGAGNDFQLYHDGTDNHINVTGAQTLNIQTSGNNAIVVDSTGHVTKPLQPAFQARPATNQSDIAINGNREVVFGTEVFDNNSDFSSNTFTAPVTGKYLITYSLYLQNLDSAANYYEAFINTSNRTYYGSSIDPDFADADFNYFSLSSSCVVDMDANDTATININQSQGTAQTDIASPSFFSGALIC